MKKTSSLLLSAFVLLLGSSAFASNFRVADTVYLPAAIHGPGQAGAFWRTDAWISNLSNDRVHIEMAFAPTSPNRLQPLDNRSVTAPANLRRLSTPLNPFERREVIDILQSVFNVGDNPGGSGMLIFFGIRDTGATAPNVRCETANNDCRLISVEARIYHTNAQGNTYGQVVTGIPWYSYISVDATGVGLHTAFITGLRQNADFRTNLGLVNASQYSTTSIRVRLFNQDATQFGSDYLQNLPPLAHVQLNITDAFPGYNASGGWVTVEQTTVTPTNPNDPDVGSGLPGFLAYGSMIDSDTNDATFLESQFTQSFSDLQAQCIFTPAGKQAPKRLIRR